MIDSGLGNKVVIVTGAAAGIGRATVLRFAEEGCRLACWDVNLDPTLSDAIRDAGGDASFERVNVARTESVQAGVEAAIAKYGRIDVLVNNAGIVRDGQLVKWKDDAIVSTMTDEQWQSVIDVNLTGVFNCTRAVAPHMIRAKSGVILTASSVVGLYGNFGQTNYTATKAGVIAMTRTWARELGRYGIRVNAVAPGFVATEILASMPDKVKQSMVDHTPIGRIGKPEDIAEAYAWLASERASFVHGTVLSVDGGLVTGS